MSKIKGIYAASMSILNDDLTLDIKKTIQHAEMVIDNGCHGAAIFGSTGQAQLLPVSEKIIDYSTFIYNELKGLGVRVILNTKSEKIGSKIRQAEIEKVNIMLILGEKELKSSLVSIRRRFEGNTGTIGIDELKLVLINEIKNRSLSHRKETATTT